MRLQWLKKSEKSEQQAPRMPQRIPETSASGWFAGSWAPGRRLFARVYQVQRYKEQDTEQETGQKRDLTRPTAKGLANFWEIFMKKWSSPNRSRIIQKGSSDLGNMKKHDFTWLGASWNLAGTSKHEKHDWKLKNWKSKCFYFKESVLKAMRFHFWIVVFLSHDL